MESSNPTGECPSKIRDDIQARLSVQLREAQHRVRNDLQTVFSILRLVERRVGDRGIPVGDVVTWLNCIASVYDALPIGEQDRRLPVRVLISVLRDRLGGPPLQVSEDDGSTASRTCGVALAMALASMLRRARLSGGAADVAIRTANGRLRVSIATREAQAPREEWRNVDCLAALEALGGVLEAVSKEGRVELVLEVPCR